MSTLNQQNSAIETVFNGLANHLHTPQSGAKLAACQKEAVYVCTKIEMGNILEAFMRLPLPAQQGIVNSYRDAKPRNQ